MIYFICSSIYTFILRLEEIMKFLRYLVSLLRLGISRYIVAFFGSCVMFLLTTLLIFANNNTVFITRLILSVLFAVIVSITAQTVSLRYRFSPLNDLLQKIASALTSVPCYFLINNINNNNYVMLGYVCVTAAVAVATVYFLFTLENESLIIPYLVKNLFFAGFFGLVFFSGITLCMYAVYYLIYEFADLQKYIITIFAFSYEVLALNLFLSLLPREGEEIRIPKAFKILVLYVAFPIYLLLLTVLYVYLGKILVTLNMPGGQINLFASFAALFFIFFRFTVIQYDHPVTRFFSRFGGYFMLPILVAQAVAVYIRLDVYGLTSARYASLLLTSVALIFIIISLIKQGRYIKHIILVVIGVALLASVTPLNIIDVPVNEQTARLERVLVNNGMFSGNKIISKTDIAEEDKKQIMSCYNYLIYQKKVPAYLEGSDFAVLFGFEQSGNNNNNVRYFNNTNNLISEIDISGYKRMLQIDKNNGNTSNARIVLTLDGTDYDITDFILSLEKNGSKNGSKDNTQITYAPAENILIYFNSIDCGINPDNTFNYYYIKGFAFIK